MPLLQEVDLEEGEIDQEGFRIKNFLEGKGISICKLEVPKARDGMRKFSIFLEFHFQKNRFGKLNLESLRKDLNLFEAGSSGKKRSFSDLFLEGK